MPLTIAAGTTHLAKSPSADNSMTPRIAMSTWTPLEPSLGDGGQLQFGNDVDLRARNYDTNTGSFTTVDPLDGVDDTTTVAMPYAYAYNNPIADSDTTGEQATDYNAFIWAPVGDEFSGAHIAFDPYDKPDSQGLANLLRGTAFEEYILDKLGLPANGQKFWGATRNAVPDATNSFEDPDVLSGVMNQIVEVKSTMYLNLSNAVSNDDGTQARVYGQVASEWGDAEVDYFIPQGAGIYGEGFTELVDSFRGVRFNIWQDIPGGGFKAVATSDKSAVNVGEEYLYNERTGFESTAEAAYNEERITELEEEGYSPSEAIVIVDGGPLEGGSGDEGGGAP
jgi:RHS repeat-associated protein